MSDLISIKAGSKAFKIIRDQGLKIDSVSVLAGASGSAKFLVLGGIDRMLVHMFEGRSKPLYLLGTSIGAFRLAAFCQPKPLYAFDVLEEAYINQQYSLRPSPDEITKVTRQILDTYIDNDHLEYMLHHPFMRLNFFSNRCRGTARFEQPQLQLATLAAAALLNLMDRRLLKLFFERALFHAPGSLPPFYDIKGFPLQRFSLSRANLKSALLSSGSIPVAMQGVSDIHDAPGVFRDGGIIDYHLDIPFLKDSSQLVLYPHFYDCITPGWFDKYLDRRAHAENMENVVLISPSKKFVKTLPLGKIPDRKDFYTFKGDDAQRRAFWRKAADQSRVLGDEFYEAVVSEKVRRMVQLIK